MAGQQPDARTALATRRETQNDTTVAIPIETRITNLEPSFQLAMPKGLEAKRLIRDALTCLRTIRDLNKCDPDSILGALMTCAQLGLRPGVLGHAWPLPYWDGRSQQHRAQLVIGYQGLIELAHRSGQIADLIARVVHANDHFDVDYGLANTLVHKPYRGGPRGPVTDYYAIVRFRAGGYAFWHMTHTEMTEHRDKYAPRNRQGQHFGPWVNEFDAMGMKTCIRLLAKYMPKTADLAEAIAADGGLRTDLDPHTAASHATATAPMWDGQEVPDETTPDPQPPASTPPPSATETPAQAPERTEHSRLLQQLHIERNKLDGLAGTSDEARELFLVHIASLLNPPREITSTKELTEDELKTVITDLRRAKREQDTRKRREAAAAKPPPPPAGNAIMDSLRRHTELPTTLDVDIRTDDAPY